MITDTSIELEVGTWTFNLIACNPYTNSTYLESTITKEIKGGENLQGNICFDAFNYENVSIFEEGITLPDNVFSLKNEEYILGTNGTISKL